MYLYSKKNTHNLILDYTPIRKQTFIAGYKTAAQLMAEIFHDIFVWMKNIILVGNASMLTDYEIQGTKISGWWESNPRIQLGRLVFYHWTTPAKSYITVLKKVTAHLIFKRAAPLPRKSMRQDLNLRPLRPERSALPSWATHRRLHSACLV